MTWRRTQRRCLIESRSSGKSGRTTAVCKLQAALQSAFFRTESGEPAIARLVYAQSSGVEEFLKGAVGVTSELAPAIPFEVRQGPLVLFDSALQGTDALTRYPKADVQPSSYQVSTKRRELENAFSFIVHRLLTAGS